MTKNQIEYWRNKETERNNLAIERETNRSNLERERMNRQIADETKRHNLETEKLGRDQFSLSMMSYRNSLSQQAWERALNLRKQDEVERHNRATRANQTKQIEYNYAVGMTNAETARMQAIESGRHNRATESAQITNLTEIMRSNLAQEDLSAARNAETARNNKALEAIRTTEQTISQGRLSLDTRKQSESERHNRVAEQETNRHNITSESIDRWNAAANIMRGSGSLIDSISKTATAHGGSIKQSWRNFKWNQTLKKIEKSN